VNIIYSVNIIVKLKLTCFINGIGIKLESMVNGVTILKILRSQSRFQGNIWKGKNEIIKINRKNGLDGFSISIIKKKNFPAFSPIL